MLINIDSKKLVLSVIKRNISGQNEMAMKRATFENRII